MKANSGDPVQTLHSAASYLGLQCLSVSHKKDARRIWIILANQARSLLLVDLWEFF